jgi:hypothetical protein
MTAKYTIRDGQVVVLPHASEFRANVQEIGEALDAISAAHGGELKPDYVVEAARDPSNPMHRHFEWDDSAAAQQWRLTQARQIIRVVRIERIEDGQEDLKRAFISAREEDGERSYHTYEAVVSSASLQRSLVEAAERELAQWIRRFNSLPVEIVDLAEQLRSALSELRRREDSAQESESAPA